jgi:hypothetical protein
MPGRQPHPRGRPEKEKPPQDRGGFRDFCGHHPRQVGATRRGGERQSETDEIVDRVADDCLVKIPDLDGDSPLCDLR